MVIKNIEMFYAWLPRILQEQLKFMNAIRPIRWLDFLSEVYNNYYVITKKMFLTRKIRNSNENTHSKIVRLALVFRFTL